MGMRNKHRKELQKLKKENPNSEFKLEWDGIPEKYNPSHLKDPTPNLAIPPHKIWIKVGE